MSKALKGISDGLAAVVKQAGPHLVGIKARRRQAATGISLGDGIIVTAHHVIRKEKDITIMLDGGVTAKADLIGRDPSTDIAVLRTDADLPAFPIADADTKVGQLIVGIGRPGTDVQATLGMVSAVGGAWRTGMGGAIDQFVQTDITMWPGFSGGPLVNASGEMIGMNTSAISRGASVTIPAATVQRVVASLVEHGKVQRGFLGLGMQSAKLPRPLARTLQQRTGLLVMSVTDGSPAASAGLAMGDTIVAINNESVSSHDDLAAYLDEENIGKTLTVSLVRGGKLQSADLIIGEAE